MRCFCLPWLREFSNGLCARHLAGGCDEERDEQNDELTAFGAATGLFIPNQQSDNLLVEPLIPVIPASVFSLITGFVAGGETGRLPQGALGGAANALANLGLLFWVLSAKDRHFVAIGGRTLPAWLPVTTVAGALLGLSGACLGKVLRKRTGYMRFSRK